MSSARAPPPKPPGPQPPSAKADLLVTKRATTDRARVGELLHYRITVTNRGPDPAAEVTLIDQPKSPADLVSAGTSHGSCTKQLPMPCNLGAMAPGEKVSIGVALRVRGPGLFINRAVAETTTEDPDLRSAEAESRVRILTPRPVPPVVGLG